MSFRALPPAVKEAAATAERGGRRLFVAVLGSADRYTDVSRLLDWAFAGVPSPCSVLSR